MVTLNKVKIFNFTNYPVYCTRLVLINWLDFELLKNTIKTKKNPNILKILNYFFQNVKVKKTKDVSILNKKI